LSDCLLIARFR